MHGLGNSRVAAAVAAGASLLLANAPALGQGTDQPGILRPSVPSIPGAARPPTGPDAGADLFALPTYGNPPGYGAGTTGFVSLGNPARKRRTKPKPAPAPAPPQGGATAVAPSGPGTTKGAPGLRPVRQLARHGVPPVDPSSALAPSPDFPLPPPPVVPLPRRAVIDPAPFDPLGLREGAFLIKPAVELTGGYDSDPERVSPRKGAFEYIVAPELIARSDWERHELDADIHGSYIGYGATFPDSPVSLNRPNLDARVDGRIDVTDADRINLESRFLVSTDNPGSPNIEAGLTKLPIVTTFGGTLGYEHDFNRFEISAKTTFDRSLWQPAPLTDGTVASDTDRNFDQYGGILRGSYEVMPGVKPFIEGDIDTRIHDLPIDRTGVNRDSVGMTVKVGSSFAVGGKLTGEFAVGETQRDYRDPALPNISGLVYDASLIFSATPLTTMKLTSTTTTGELIVPGASGVLRRDLVFEVDHDFRRWLTGAVKFGYGADTYFGLDRLDNRYVAGASLTYRLSRTVQIRGEYRHEWLRSTTAFANYDADVVLMTLRLQR